MNIFKVHFYFLSVALRTVMRFFLKNIIFSSLYRNFNKIATSFRPVLIFYPMWGMTIRQYVGQTCWAKQTLLKLYFHKKKLPLPLDPATEHMFSLAVCHLSQPAWVFNEHVIHLLHCQTKLHLFYQRSRISVVDTSTCEAMRQKTERHTILK